jgi:hypothetical protein
MQALCLMKRQEAAVLWVSAHLPLHLSGLMHWQAIINTVPGQAGQVHPISMQYTTQPMSRPIQKGLILWPFRLMSQTTGRLIPIPPFSTSTVLTGREGMKMKKRLLVLIFLVLLILVSMFMQTYAQECRRIQPIKSPAVVETPLAEGVRPVKEQVPVDRQTVEKTMQKIAESWNTPEMSKKLADSFYEKDRLMDSINGNVPVDAQLRLLSVGSYRIMNQGIKQDPGGDLLISRVSVIAKTQIEYNNPTNGFQRRQGEQEYIIKIIRREAVK